MFIGCSEYFLFFCISFLSSPFTVLRLKNFDLSSLLSSVFSFSLWKKEGLSFLSQLEVQYSVDQQCYAISGLSTSPRAAELCCWLTWLWGVRCFYRETHLICCPLLTGNPKIKLNISFEFVRTENSKKSKWNNLLAWKKQNCHSRLYTLNS